MGNEQFERFLTKMCELETIYRTFKKEEQEVSLKVLVSLCKRFEMALGPSFSMTTDMLCTTQGIEDYFIQVMAFVLLNAQGGLDELMAPGVDMSQRELTNWPNTGLGETPQADQPVEAGLKTESSACFTPNEDSDNSEAVPSERRKSDRFCSGKAISESIISELANRAGQASTAAGVVPKEEAVSDEDTIPLVSDRDSDSQAPGNTNNSRRLRRRSRLKRNRTRFTEVKKKRLGRPRKPDSFDCDQCAETFSQHVSLLSHSAGVHGDAPRCCRRCRRVFLNEVEVGHLCKKRYPKGPKVCRVCGKAFMKITLLKRHLWRRHGIGKPEKTPDLRPIECFSCQLVFKTRRELQSHIRESCPAAEKKRRERFVCEVCGKSLMSKYNLVHHMNYHTGAKPYQCEHCGFKFREFGNLKRHILLHFEGQRRHICEVCGAAFHNKATLADHIGYKHNEERNFPCPECPLKFKVKSALKSHQRKVHCPEMKHKCWCGAAFKALYKLRQHCLSYHGSDAHLPPVRHVRTLDGSKLRNQFDTGTCSSIKSEAEVKTEL